MLQGLYIQLLPACAGEREVYRDLIRYNFDAQGVISFKDVQSMC